MKRLQLDMLAGAFITVVSVVVGLPVLITGLRDESVPHWVWMALFVGYLVAQTMCMWFQDMIDRRVLMTAFGAMVVLGPLLVLAASGAGWLPILLIFTAALSAMIASIAVTAAVVVANTVIIAVSTAMVTDRLVEIALMASIYGALQIASVASILSQQKQDQNQRALTAAHVELRTASALLADSSRSEERLRIARELHDLLGHQLTALSLELEVASHKCDPPAEEHVRRAQSVARGLLADVRSTVGELRRRAPDLRDTVDRIVTDLPELSVHVTVGDAVSPGEESSGVLVRCVQEVVTNTIKHSDAGRLWIDFSADDIGTTVLTARDDGSARTEFVHGNGLIGMKERVVAVDGDVKFWVDNGFHVRVEVPA